MQSEQIEDRQNEKAETELNNSWNFARVSLRLLQACKYSKLFTCIQNSVPYFV